MRNILLCVVAILLPTFALTQAKPGIVIVRGKVSINGKAVQHSDNIFPGETLKTGSNGAASITGEGVNASVGNSASLVYGNNSVNLDCGRVQVATLKGFTVEVHSITASPTASGLTKFEVSQNPRVLSIHALEGPIAIGDGQQRSTLNPGEKRDFQRGAPCAVAAPMSPLVPATIFGASTFPIWLTYGRSITPSKP